MALRDILDFEAFNLKDILKKLKDDPERIALGAGDPLTSKFWSKVTGKDYEPLVDQMGGAYGGHTLSAFGNNEGGVYGRAKAAGIDTAPGAGAQDLAHIVAAQYATQGLGNAAGVGKGGGTAGGTGTAGINPMASPNAGFGQKFMGFLQNLPNMIGNNLGGQQPVGMNQQQQTEMNRRYMQQLAANLLRTGGQGQGFGQALGTSYLGATLDRDEALKTAYENARLTAREGREDREEDRRDKLSESQMKYQSEQLKLEGQRNKAQEQYQNQILDLRREAATRDAELQKLQSERDIYSHEYEVRKQQALTKLTDKLSSGQQLTEQEQALLAILQGGSGFLPPSMRSTNPLFGIMGSGFGQQPIQGPADRTQEILNLYEGN